MPCGVLEVEVTNLVAIKSLYEEDVDFGDIYQKMSRPLGGREKGNGGLLPPRRLSLQGEENVHSRVLFKSMVDS